MSNDALKTRLYINAPLASGSDVMLPLGQTHYLLNVLRLSKSAKIAVFNGVDGEFEAEISTISRKQSALTIGQMRRPHQQCRDLWLMFAPVKKARLDFIAQKASELGVRVIWPVNTEFCQVSRVKNDRMIANAIEAAEQTERLDIAEVRPFTGLDEALATCEDDRLLIWCDETCARQQAHNIMAALLDAPAHSKAAILIGPEGGFSKRERNYLSQQKNCLKVSLGPRILRSDTAAISALSCYQSICGDWQDNLS